MVTSNSNQNNLFGVVAADLPISNFDTVIKNELGFRCQDTRATTCFLVDTSGYVVFHPRFAKRNVYDDIAIVTNKHITEIHGHIASHLIKTGVMKKKTCQDFTQRKLQIFYEVSCLLDLAKLCKKTFYRYPDAASGLVNHGQGNKRMDDLQCRVLRPFYASPFFKVTFLSFFPVD